jgi:hypothetical protein
MIMPETPKNITTTQNIATADEKKVKPFSINQWFSSNLMFLLFLFGITLLYIRNTHYSEGLIRAIETTKQQTKEMRWEYMTVKAELMFQTKQTEIAKLVANQGLKELTNPPQKITIKKQ